MNDKTTVAPIGAEIKDQARAHVREALGNSSVYQSMSLADQKSIYLSMVDDEVDKRRARMGLSRSQATDSGKEMGYKGYDPGFGGDTKAFNELVDSVDFPKFVADLLKAVFDANLKVMKEQTDSYIKLMKEASKSSADFIKMVKDDDAFAKMAETNSQKYNLTTEKNPDGTSKLALTAPDGSKHDTDDAAVKRDLFEAKLKMAQEHRAALREVLLMGVTRLVVKSGEIEAGVEFSIKANRESKAHHDDQNINTVNAETSFGGGIGSFLGGPSATIQMSNTNIQVNTSDKKATDDLSAKLQGKVKINFMTDYFKLDNFQAMYGDGGVAALKPGGGAPPPAAPGR